MTRLDDIEGRIDARLAAEEGWERLQRDARLVGSDLPWTVTMLREAHTLLTQIATDMREDGYVVYPEMVEAFVARLEGGQE
jgi:hypothetical protein